MNPWDMWMVRRKPERRKPYEVFAVDERQKEDIAETFHDLASAQEFAAAANEMLLAVIKKETKKTA